jgi:hypothetical protein
MKPKKVAWEFMPDCGRKRLHEPESRWFYVICHSTRLQLEIALSEGGKQGFRTNPRAASFLLMT